MLSLEVFLIGESLNNDPAQLHGDSDVPSDQVSNVHAGDVVTSCIVVCPNAGTTTSTGGLTIEKKTHPYFVVCFIPMEDEVESPRSNPPRNTIDLCLEAMTIQVIPRWPFIPSLPPLRKPSVTKEYLPIALLAYSLVHEEVRSYASSFLTYESIVEFLNLIEFCHIGRSYVMFVESCRESEHVFIRAFLCPSKRERLEPVSVVIPSFTKSHPTFLCIKEGVSSLRGKDFNLKALIQASMLGQFDRDMVRETLLGLAEESWESLVYAENKLKEDESQEETYRTQISTTKDLSKALQEEIECLNKEVALFKVNTDKIEEKLKTDLGKVEAEILKTYEAGFNKAFRQVKYFFRDVNTSLFDVDKDVICQGELVSEVEMCVEEVLDLA
ncbi:hypothetical protein JHK82_050165 [Glycine max]|nr:hypothetical protein JHK82_050165 [Glycine max]